MKLKILLCPDSFKGSLSSRGVCHAIKKGFLRCTHEIEIVEKPIADGGEGTIEALYYGLGGRLIKIEITGPLWGKVNAQYLILKDQKTAVIEMAQAAGLTLVPIKKRNPRYTTTFGVGELMIDAVKNGCKKLILAIGGSATNDGGMGALTALGVKFYDENQKLLSGMGENLPKVQTIDTDGIVKVMNEVEILIASDVKNPLFGLEGAARVYAPQKGANDEDVLFLDKGLIHFSKMIQEKTGKEVESIPGSGAAGGIGAGFCGFLNAQITSGIQLIMELLKFDEEIAASQLIISGEGRIDRQTLYGKVISGIYELCQKHNKPLILLAGKIEEEAYSIYGEKVLGLFSIVNGPIHEDEAFLKAEYFVENTSYNIAKLIFHNFS
ncbi:MAG: glycerate kinase [Candidatus Atribacteria bacterium]|nr:glycerate kinase [Candidatus Atribacteria bacterium]